jgi:hypothetical protein
MIGVLGGGVKIIGETTQCGKVLSLTFPVFFFFFFSVFMIDFRDIRRFIDLIRLLCFSIFGNSLDIRATADSGGNARGNVFQLHDSASDSHAATRNTGDVSLSTELSLSRRLCTVAAGSFFS